MIVFDLETTGIDPQVDHIVEIGLYDTVTKETTVFRVNPEMSIPAGASEVHGILDEHVAAEPTFKQLWPSIRHHFEGPAVGGYNAIYFDLPLLQAECERNGFPIPNPKVVDALVMWKKLEPRNLTNATMHFTGEFLDDAHHAGADAEATGKVIDAMREMYPIDHFSDEELALEYAPPGKILNGCINFGKHKGTPMAEVPVSYLRWIMKSDFDDATKKEVQKYV